MKTYFVWVSTLLLALPILTACNGVFATIRNAKPSSASLGFGVFMQSLLS